MTRTLAALIVLAALPEWAGDFPLVPNDTLTPGVVATTDLKKICRSGYSKTVRHTSAKLKADIYAEYHIDKRKIHGEVDHRVPLVAGGADVRENLWIEDYDSKPYNAHMKDHLEVVVRRLICQHAITVEEGQAVFLGDWRDGYDKYIGKSAGPR